MAVLKSGNQASLVSGARTSAEATDPTVTQPRLPWTSPLPPIFQSPYQKLPASMRKSRARPDPVSCQLCRTKKLKCNRVQPCSNCLARGVTCNFVVPPEKQTETASTISNGEAVLGRIERLESIILRSTFVNSASATIAHDNHVPRLGLQSRSKGDGISFTHRKQDEDSRLLENLGTREDSLVCHSSKERIVYTPIKTFYSFLVYQMDWLSK